MSRRLLLSVTMFTAPLVAAAIACGFPDVTFGPATASEAGTDARPDVVSTIEEDAGEDASSDVVIIDVATRDDSSVTITDASICATKALCDCDDDEYADKKCPVDASGLKSAKGNLLKPGDCDDLDGLRHPDQAYVDEVPPPGKNGDWNCDNVVDTPDPNGLDWCSGNPLIGGCSGGPGFINATIGCGESADLYTCVAENLSCKQKLAEGQTRKKRCR